MHVSNILRSKGRAVITTGPGETVAATARLLSSHRIGAVLVLDAAGEIAGIISERDIVALIAREGAAALNRDVAEAMTRDVVACAPGDTVGSVMQKMTEHRFRHLPVLEDGRLAGMISIGDVVKYRLEEAQHEVEALRDYVLGTT